MDINLHRKELWCASYSAYMILYHNKIKEIVYTGVYAISMLQVFRILIQNI